MADTGPPPPPDSNSVESSAATGSSSTNGPRLWEKPWSFDEMRNGANNWSLAGDAGLLLYLQDFSQRMISRVHEIEKEVDGLLHDSKLTDVRVHNVFNDFIMLADTQFVENRVYDEDVSQEEPAKSEAQAETKEKTREEKEAELIPRVKEALELGIHVIDQAYEQLDSHVADSDSEEEETGYRVDPLLEAKDPYLNRPLPKMIGSPTFMEDDNVGLLEEESDGEETDNGSVSESDEEEDEKKVSTDDEYYSSEDDSEAEKKPKPSKPVIYDQDESDSESDGSLFGDAKKKGRNLEDSEESSEEEDEEEEEEEEEKPKKSAGPIDFAAELAAKLGGPQKKQQLSESEEEDAEKTEIIEDEGKKKKNKKDRKHKDPTSKKSEKGKKEKVKHQQEDEPFPQEEEDDPFGVNKGGMFSSGRGLFDDDDEDNEGDMFDEPDEVKPKAVKEEKSKKSKTEKVIDVKATKPSSGGLFSEDEDDLFASMSSTTTKPRKSSAPKEPSDLFADNDDEESNLFSSEAPPAEPSKPQKKGKDKKMPAGAVSMFGGASNPLAAAIKKRNKVEESDEGEKEWSEDDKSRSGSIKSNQSATSINTRQRVTNKASPSPSSNSLFEDDVEDDALFSSPVKPRSNSKAKPKETKSLFDDEDEGDLFGTGSKPQPTQKKETGKSKSGSLFGAEDDVEDPMFGQPAKSIDSKKPPGGVSLFGGVDVLNKQKDKPVTKEPEPVKSKAPVSKKISLFDEDDEEEDLFGTGPVKTDVPKPAAQAKPMSKAKGLFDDDDLLFGGAVEESPDVDIFGSTPTMPPAPKSGQTVDKAKATTKSQPPIAGPKLLDDDDDGDDGDLFSTKSKTIVKSEESIKVEGATTTESSDQPIEEPPEEVKPKKPVGGVSMFGGMDPFAALKKNKPVAPKEEVKESPPAVAKSATISPTPGVSKPTKVPAKEVAKDPLFGEDEDEEDDLFGIKKPTPAKATPKAVPKSDSLFGSPSSPPSDLFGSSNTPILSESPAQTKPVKKPDVSSRIFESDESNEDDMFSTATATTKKEDKIEEEPAEAPPVSKGPKKPPGAVSMFGGVDLFAGLKKEKPVVTEPAESDEQPNEDSISQSKPSPSASSPKKSPPGKIGKLQMNLGINPAALLPGAAPPTKEPENVAIGFDEPAKATTLQSANKSRAKIQAKRRPPSRHSRQSVSPSENKSDILSSSASEDVVTPELPSFNDRVPQPTSDLFGNDDLLGESTPSSPPLVSKTPILEEKQADKFEDDLFSTSKKKTPVMSDEDLFGGPVSTTPKSKSVLSTGNDDDIFSSSSLTKPRKTDDIFSPSSRTKSTESDDDIFSPSSRSKATSKSSSAMVNGVGDDIFSSSKPKAVIKEEEEDDIFSTKSKTKKPTDFEKILDSTTADSKDVKKSDNIDSRTTSKTETVEDDIFADSSLFKKKENKVSAEKEEVKTTVDTDSVKVNDEVATPVTKSKGKKTKAKAKTKDEDLFQDKTDIFADVPASKPKEKKKKKTTTEKKSLFKDDIDDIFSTDTKAAKAKAKKDKKATETDKGKTKASNDVVDIFDDPLS